MPETTGAVVVGDVAIAVPSSEAVRDAVARQVCRTASVTVTAYLCACFLGFDDRFRLGCVAMGGVIAFWQGRGVGLFQTEDWFRRLAMHFLSWMTLRSCLEYGLTNIDYSKQAGYWMMGTLLLGMFGAMVWRAVSDDAAVETMCRWMGLSAAFAAAVSLVLFYGVLPGHVFGERLGNWFIYGGLNPVSTGLLFGFAAMWLITQEQRTAGHGERLLHSAAVMVLIAAVLFTRSRGALLALVAGHVALTCVRGVRQTVFPWLALGGMTAVFILAGPVITRVAADQAMNRAGMGMAHASVEQVVMQRMQGATPARDMLARKDSGRLMIYERAVRSLGTAKDWLFGVGQWGAGESSIRGFGYHRHLHSVYLATLVHGGIIGLGLLLTLLGVGFRRAWRLARDGRHVWFVLLAYGCAGLLFDGQTLTTLTSLPQMETLLITFPLVAAAAVGRRKVTAQ